MWFWAIEVTNSTRLSQKTLTVKDTHQRSSYVCSRGYNVAFEGTEDNNFVGSNLLL